MASGNVPIAQRQAGIYFAFAYEQLTVTNAVKTLTSTVYQSGDKKAQIAFITVEDADIRFTYDGSTPSATNGHLLRADSVLTLYGTHDIENFKAFRAAGTDAEINVTYEG